MEQPINYLANFDRVTQKCGGVRGMCVKPFGQIVDSARLHRLVCGQPGDNVAGGMKTFGGSAASPHEGVRKFNGQVPTRSDE